MKLENLALINFRNHTNTVLELSKKINVFIGPNASGKSSICDALVYLFTGKNGRDEKSSTGLTELITFGESRAMVSSDINGIGKITRCIPHSLQVSGWSGGLRDQQNKLYDAIKSNEDAVICCLNSNEFINMDASDKKNFIFNLMGMHLDSDKVKMEFLRWAKENNIQNPMNILNLMPSDIIFDGSHEKLDEAYKHFFTSRKFLKKEIKELEVKAQDNKSQLPENVTVDNKDAILKKMKELKDGRDELMLQLGKIQSMVKQHLELTKVIDAKVDTVPGTLKDFEKSVSKAEKTITELKERHAKESAEIKVISDLTAKLENFNGKCPLLDDFDCAAGNELIKVRDENKLKIKEKTKMINDITSALQKLGNEKEVLEKNIVIKQNELKHDDDVKKAKEELKSITKLGDPKKIQDDINAVSERLTKGQSILTMIDAEILNGKQQKAASIAMDKKKNDLKKTEILVDAFGPKGIKTILLNRALKPLQEKVSEKMQLLTDGKYSIDFRIKEKNFDIYVTSDGIERSIKHLSTSERLRTGIIMQDAINSMAGFKMIVIDQVDMLDDDNKKLLWKLIDRIKDNYETIIILSTGLSVKDTNKPDVNMFYIG